MTSVATSAELSRGHAAEVRFAAGMSKPDPSDSPDLSETFADWERRVPESVHLVTDEHLQGISSRNDFIGKEHMQMFRQQACPHIEQRADLFVPWLVLEPHVAVRRDALGNTYNSIEAKELGLDVRPRAEVGLTASGFLPERDVVEIGRDFLAVRVGSLIDFVEKDTASKFNLFEYGPAEKELLKRLVEFLKYKTRYVPDPAEVEAMYVSSMRVMDEFMAALDDPDSTIRRGWTPEFTQSIGRSHVGQGIGTLRLLERMLPPKARAALRSSEEDNYA